MSQAVTCPGSTNALYTYAPQLYGNLISQRRGTTSHWHLFDALGSTLALTDSAMAVSDSYFYEAYGEIAASSGSTANPFKWVGQVGYYTESPLANLPYVRARYYNTVLARWMSRDPIGYMGSEWNLYEYVRGRPLSWIDPEGLRDKWYENCIARRQYNIEQRAACENAILDSEIPMEVFRNCRKYGYSYEYCEERMLEEIDRMRKECEKRFPAIDCQTDCSFDPGRCFPEGFKFTLNAASCMACAFWKKNPILCEACWNIAQKELEYIHCLYTDAIR